MSDDKALARATVVHGLTAGIRESPLQIRMDLVLHAFLNAVPYAGGSISSVLSNNTTNKKFERVCDALETLHARIEDQKVKVEEVLSEDEVVEVLNKTLAEIAVATDSEKIKFLKHGLAASFTSKEISFGRKQFFLNLLRSLGSLELSLIHALYIGADPYIQTDIEMPPGPTGLGFTAPAAPFLMTGAGMVSRDFKEWRDDDQKPKLSSFLASRLGEPEEIVIGIATSLDRSGLTLAAPVLERKHYKVFVEKRDTTASHHLAVMGGQSSILTGGEWGRGITNRPSATPIEMARTELGRSFVRFVTAM
jgi:hypothetical protein